MVQWKPQEEKSNTSKSAEAYVKKEREIQVNNTILQPHEPTKQEWKEIQN